MRVEIRQLVAETAFGDKKDISHETRSAANVEKHTDHFES